MLKCKQLVEQLQCKLGLVMFLMHLFILCATKSWKYLFRKKKTPNQSPASPCPDLSECCCCILWLSLSHVLKYISNTIKNIWGFFALKRKWKDACSDYRLWMHVLFQWVVSMLQTLHTCFITIITCSKWRHFILLLDQLQSFHKSLAVPGVQLHAPKGRVVAFCNWWIVSKLCSFTRILHSLFLPLVNDSCFFFLRVHIMFWLLY